jgi:hypothetical protein
MAKTVTGAVMEAVKTSSGVGFVLLYRLLTERPRSLTRIVAFDFAHALPKASKRRAQVATGGPETFTAEQQQHDKKENDQLPTADATNTHGMLQLRGTTRLNEVLDRTMTSGLETRKS